MCYVRGAPWDYDHWRDLGCEGWSWQDVLPFFRKSEDQERGASEYHGVGGPLRVSDQAHWELGDRFIEAAVQYGLKENPDFNGPVQEGVGYYQRNTRRNARMSTAKAFITPARSRANLKVETDALASRILIENGRAVGVEYVRGGEKRVARARGEVVISTGCFNTPKLLQLSGLGPAAELKALGIPVVRDMPGVGADLRDHHWVKLSFRCTRAITVNEFAHSPVKKAAAALQYAFNRSGPLATTGVTVGAFVRTDPKFPTPNLQFNFLGWSMTQPDTTRVNPDPFPGFSIILVDLKPNNRGKVSLRSTRPDEPPAIRMNFMQDGYDREPVIRGIRMLRDIVGRPALAPYVDHEIEPGKSVQTEDELEAFVRARSTSNQHAVGTCRMGADPASVVDPRLRVRGVAGLRIADASIMPEIVSGNTNAPIIMIGEKAAAMLLEDARQPALT
jgi:choline dehydrogenase